MKHLNDPPPPIFGISSDLQLIIDRTLAKDPDIRYATAKELADEFMAVFNGQTVSADTIRLLKASQKPAEAPEKQDRPLPWAWIGAGAILLVALTIGAFRFLTLPKPNENQIVGRVAFLDSYLIMDKVTVSLSSLPKPDSGFHYEAWLLAQGGEIRRNIGTVTVDESEQGQLSFINPTQSNVFSAFDQVEVTLEVDNDPNPDEPSDEIVASSVFPPLALVHVRHLTTGFQTAPNATALIQGLWAVSDSLDTSGIELQEAFDNEDEDLVRLKTEEIINQIVGSANTQQYKDWNGDGTLNDPSDGFGLLQNGDPGYTDQGYIEQSISHAKFAADAADATPGIQTNSASLVICSENMMGWSEQVLEKALQLQETPFGPEMEPLIKEISALSTQIVSGVDSNENESIEPIPGEGGADTAYEYAYFMAEMPLLPGEHRIPPPVVEEDINE
jgi:hypothetical protein